MVRRVTAVVSLGLSLLVMWPSAGPGVRADGAVADSHFAGLELSVAEIVQALAHRRPATVKPVGTSSVVFKVDLEGPIDAAFRPESRLNPRGHLAEISAFRVGCALGLDNVAPAVPRTLTLDELHQLLAPSYETRWPSLVADMVAHDGAVSGVFVYWIPDLHELGIDTPDGIKRWARWLSQDGAVPDRDKPRLLSAQISTMITFDYLIGNFDRFSGANAQGDHSEQHLFLRDHNMAFFEPLRLSHHQRVLSRLKRVQRFSRQFMEQLKQLTPERLERELTRPEDPKGQVVLSQGQVRGLLDRRKAILSYVSALIDRHGEHNVLTFE